MGCGDDAYREMIDELPEELKDEDLYHQMQQEEIERDLQDVQEEDVPIEALPCMIAGYDRPCMDCPLGICAFESFNAAEQERERKEQERERRGAEYRKKFLVRFYPPAAPLEGSDPARRAAIRKRLEQGGILQW